MMKKITCFLLACLMIVSVFSVTVSAALPETAVPLWNNTKAVYLAHDAVGTTAHCYADIDTDSGSSLRNVVIYLTDQSTGTVVKTWTDPEMTVDACNTFSFYGTVANITLGHTYCLYLQCEVWHNGVRDDVTASCVATYSATE